MKIYLVRPVSCSALDGESDVSKTPAILDHGYAVTEEDVRNIIRHWCGYSDADITVNMSRRKAVLHEEGCGCACGETVVTKFVLIPLKKVKAPVDEPVG